MFRSNWRVYSSAYFSSWHKSFVWKTKVEFKTRVLVVNLNVTPHDAHINLVTHHLLAPSLSLSLYIYIHWPSWCQNSICEGGGAEEKERCVWEGEKWKQKQKLINIIVWGRNQNVGTRFDERHDNWMGWIPLIQGFAVTPDTVPKVFNPQRLPTSVQPRCLWMRPMLLFSLFIIDPNLLLRHFLRIPAPISGNLYSKCISLSWGGSSPLLQPLPFYQALFSLGFASQCSEVLRLQLEAIPHPRENILFNTRKIIKSIIGM
jgi:hypothetical protein